MDTIEREGEPLSVASIAPRQGMELFASRPGRGALDELPRWDVVVECVDWNRVLIEAEGLHQRKLREDRTHSRIVSGCPTETCGPCLKDVLLDRNWSAAS